MKDLLSTVILMSDPRLLLSTSPWWYALIAALLVAAAYAVYRYTLPPVSRWRRTLLWVLRGLALALLLLLLFEPVLTYFRQRKEPPTVALLVDRSASMQVKNRGEDREAELHALLESSRLRSLAQRARMRVFTFADTTAEIPHDSLPTIPLDGIGSNLAGSWKAVGKALAGENLAAVVLISDGAHNQGENPVRAAQESTTPIYCIGVGDTSKRVDAAIVEILTNEVTYVGHRVPIDLRVRASGLSEKASQLRLVTSGGTELAQASVKFTSDESEVSVSLGFTANAPGDVRIEARLDSVAGEATLDNNRRSVVIRALERKSRVLLIAGAPSPDFTALRQTLEMDSALEVRSFVEGAGGRFLYNAGELTPEDYAAASLVVWVDYPTRSTSPGLLETAVQVINEKETPILFLVGPHVAFGQLAKLSEVMPFSASKQVLSEELVVARAVASHSALTGRSPLPADWSDLPPILGGAGNFVTSVGAQVVVKLSREALGMTEDEPGVVIWQIGRRRGIAFLCWETYRWKLQLVQNPGQAEFYSDVMSRLIAWLVAPPEERRVRITATKKLYSGGERVRLVGQVYGADLSPREDAAVEVRVVSESRSEVVPLRGRGNGRYEGDFDPWGEAEYRFTGTAKVGQDTMGSDRGMFVVEGFNIERIDPRARFDILRQIAVESRGGFAVSSQVDSLLPRISLEPRTITSHREIPLWNRAVMMWVIIGLLGTEWWVRKRSGML